LADAADDVVHVAALQFVQYEPASSTCRAGRVLLAWTMATSYRELGKHCPAAHRWPLMQLNAYGD
jgi:hypothetical protein